jgi:hypothetical protein
VVPFARHLSFGANPRGEVSIGWQVPAVVTRPFVRYGDSPWNLGHKVPAEIRALHSEVLGAIAPVDQYYVHATLDNLQPGRSYFYAVGHDGYDPGDLTTFGRIDSFTTAPSRRRVADPFSFTAFGDQGVSYHALSNDGVIAAQNPAFHLHAGDIAYADSSGSGSPVSTDGRNGTDVFDPRVWDQFLAQTESIAASVPWMVATGNHDMEALYSPDGYGGDIARFDLPGNGPERCPSVYSYIYGNVAVISLDANDVSYEIPANLGYSGGSQTSWLHDRLKFLRGQPDVDFIVVFFHHCAYSTTNNHASEGGAHPVGTAVRPVQGRPGHQRPQPHLRAHGRAARRGAQGDADRRDQPPGHRRHHLRHGRRRRAQPLQLPGARLLRRPRQRPRLGPVLRLGQRLDEGDGDGDLVPGALHRLLVPGGRRQAGRRGAQDDPHPARAHRGGRGTRPGRAGAGRRPLRRPGAARRAQRQRGVSLNDRAA